MRNDKVKFSEVLISVWFWFSLFFFSGLMFPVALVIWVVTVLFDRRRYILHQFTCRWSDVTLFLNPYWKLTVKGREKVDPKKVYVMVSNHQSGLDILVLFKLRKHFKWVAKQELFTIPFIGWNMALNGYIPIQRSRGRSKMQMMDRAAASIARGNSVMLFPEGTRSPDGTLQQYKTGAFRLALETGTDILPVALKGTCHAVKKGGLIIHGYDRIELVVLDPIPYREFCQLESKEVARMVYQATLKEIEKQVV